MRSTPRRRWLAVGLGVVLLAGVGVAIAGAQSDDTPRGTDPLSAAEEEVALGLARGSNPGESTGLGDDDVVLMVERHEEAKAAPEDLRRAEVYVYSYDDDVLTWTLVDLAEGEVVQSRSTRNAQPPLTDEEGARALEIALDDPAFEPRLATAFRQATGRDLADPATDLIVQPIVFTYGSEPGLPAAARQCGRHRCAQLLLQSSDRLLVNLLPIVDLSAGRLASAGRFS